MFVQAISPPLELMDHLYAFCYQAECYLFSRPLFELSIALKQVARELPSGSAAFQLRPFLQDMGPRQLAGLAKLVGIYSDAFNASVSDQFVVQRILESIDRGALTVYSVPEQYYSRLNDSNDIFYKPLSSGVSDRDPISKCTDTLWQTLGGSAGAKTEIDVAIPPLAFPELKKLGSVEVDLSEHAIHTRSDIVPQKLGLHAVKDNALLCKEVEQLGCSASLARTALDRGLTRWQVLSDYKYGRQLLNFFWMQTDARAQDVLLKRNTETPSYVFRLPCEVFLALGAVGFKNLRGITDPRLRVGPFNVTALEAMAALADQLTQQANVDALEAEALRDDTGPQSRSHLIWADLPKNYYVQLRLKYDNNTPVENEVWWIETPDGREHTGRTNVHGVGRVSGLQKMGRCRIKFLSVPVAQAGEPRSRVVFGETYTESVNGEYEFFTIPPIRILYQFDVDAPGAKNEEIILEHNQSDWEQRICVGSLTEFDHDWVELVFHGLPESGTFNLTQDPKDGGDPYFIFDEVPYGKLDDILCDLAEPTELEPEDEEDDDEAIEPSRTT